MKILRWQQLGLHVHVLSVSNIKKNTTEEKHNFRPKYKCILIILAYFSILTKHKNITIELI
jgi:hypothetical protein